MKHLFGFEIARDFLFPESVLMYNNVRKPDPPDPPNPPPEPTPK